MNVMLDIVLSDVCLHVLVRKKEIIKIFLLNLSPKLKNKFIKNASAIERLK